jgi:serine phosphatase RsbU (regulator of sigma subunit)/ligand-binding sensor domain-containing protein
MKRLKKYFNIQIVLTFFMCSLSYNIQAQQKYFFEKLSVSDGLSNSVVLCTYQDRLGYLWIGTMDGLNRYDGYDIKVYKNIPSDSTSIQNNIIFSIGEDSGGNLLFGTNDYVGRYNRESDNFTNFKIDKGSLLNYSRVMNFLNDSKGRLWIATSYTGVQIFDTSINNFREIDFRDYSGELISYASQSITRVLRVGAAFRHIISNVTELKNGNILATSQNHGIFIYNSSQNEFQPYFSKPKINKITEIFEDSTGKLWIIATDDIYIYNPSTYDLKPLNITARLPKRQGNNNFFNIHQEQSKKIFIGSESGIIETDLNTKKLSLITENITNLNPNSLYRDNFGIYWISSSGNGLVRFDPAKKPFQFFGINNNGQSEIKTNPVRAIAQNPLEENELLLSLEGEGIFSFNRKSLQFRKIHEQAATLLLPDKNENLWYTQGRNLNALNLKSGEIESFAFPNPEYSRDYIVNQLKFGPDNKIWIADGQGIQTFNPDTKVFDRLPSIMNKPLSLDIMTKVRNIARTEKAIAAIHKVGEDATFSKEFKLEKPSKVLILNFGEGRANNLTRNMFDFGWLSDNKGKKIWSADKIENTFYAGGGFKNRIALACLDLPAGTFKINFVSDIGHSFGAFNVTPPPDSTWYGIQVIRLDNQQYAWFNEKLSLEPDNTHYPTFEWVNNITFSRKYFNTAWIAPLGTGLIRHNLKDNTQKNYRFDNGTQRFPLRNRLQQILEDKDGILWIKTEGGLIKFNPETEQHQFITEQDGLVSNQVFFMKEDQNDNIWFGTAGGISMLDRQNAASQLSFVNYDNTDGIKSLPLNESIAMTNDGEIFYGGFGGLNAFYPGSANTTMPKPIITSLSISGVPIEKLASKFNLKTNISETNQLELVYSDNNLAIEFASIHFSRPAKNKLAYMLEGIDKDWSYTKRRFASYLNLPPGDYVFRLKGSNGDGFWNPEETTLGITITPPWWRTYWAYFGYLFLTVLIVFSIDRIQRARVKAQEKHRAEMAMLEAENKRKSQELEEARQLQLSMLPKELPQLPNLDIAVYMQTATEVGGDYYDFHIGLDGTLTVVIGDATGHGMKAGTMVTAAKSLFNSYAPNPDILFSFSEITRCIKQMNFGKLSMCLTMLKIKGDKMQMSTAGMPPSFIFRADTRVVEEHLFKAMPLGTMLKFPYEVKKTTLNPGDTILLMSDGLPELQNDKEEMYGYKRIRNGFEDVAEKQPEEIIAFLKKEGKAWNGDQAPDDDVTFVVIKVK